MKNNISKKEFLIKFSAYILIGILIPFAFLAWRFGIFKAKDKLHISGWGLIAIIFIGLSFIKVIKEIRKGMKKWSLARQCFDGITKTIIPLMMAALACYYLKDTMDELFQFLCILVLCQCVAIVINPLPKWEEENEIEHQENTFKRVIDIFKK